MDREGPVNTFSGIAVVCGARGCDQALLKTVIVDTGEFFSERQFNRAPILESR